MSATDAVAVGGLHPASAPQRARTPGRAIIWFLFPAAFLLVVVLVVPLCATVWLSLSPNVLINFPGHGVANYSYLLGKAYYQGVMLRTLRLAAEVTFFAVLIGYPAALAMRTLSARASTMLALAMTLPVLSGPLVVILGFMILLSDGGPMLQPLQSLGLPRLRLLGSEAGIVIGIVHFVLPFVIMSLASLLRGIPDTVIEAARSLGASPWQRFRRIIWPLSLPGVLSAMIIAFSLSTGSFIAPHYLGGVADLTLTTLVTQFMMATFNGQLAATASVILLVVLTAVIFLSTVLISRRIR